MNNLIDDYFEYQTKYEKIYGERTLFLMQVGSFYEAYQTLDEGYDLTKISNMLNIILSKRNKSILKVDRKNPYMMGFPLGVIDKYLKILIQNGYTIVLCGQVTPPPNPKREIIGIYSPGTYIEDQTNLDNNYLLSIYIEEINNLANNKPVCIVGLALIDLSTGNSLIHQIVTDYNDDKLALDEAIKFINSYSIREIIITTSNLNSMNKNKLEMYLEIKEKIFQHKTIEELKKIKGFSNILNINYQQEFLKKIYHKQITNNLTPIEFLNMERLDYARNAFIILLQFVYEHNQIIINKINIPEIYSREDLLHCGNNAIYQLNVFQQDNANSTSFNTSIKSLFDVINKTSTPMGRRYLKNILAQPLTNKKELEYRYNLIEYIIKNKLVNNLDKSLNQIGDIERLDRKIKLNNIHPLDFNNWILSHDKINILLKELSNDDISLLFNFNLSELTMEHKQMLNYINEIFNMNELPKYLINDITSNIFNVGISPEIDNLQDQINLCTKFMDYLAIELSKYLTDKDASIKVESNDREGHYLSLTKRRADMLEKELKNIKEIKIKDIVLNTSKLTFKHAAKGSTSKIFLPELEKNSDKIIQLTNQLKLIIKDTYIKELNNLLNKFNDIIDKITNIITFIDYIKSGAKISILYNYTKPILIESEKSYIRVEKLRHPIVERINQDTEYIPVNISLGIDNQDGILLFGLNSAGKSTLQKAIGLSVIMAQIGYFVPATKYELSLYKAIFTRISGCDNLFKGLSSFTLELVELSAILKRYGPNTLVIADEVSNGTEHISSLIIVMTMIEMLAKSGTSFISATHLHELCDLESLEKLNNVKQYHLHVEFDEINNILKYDRQLREGSGLSFYGLQVAKYLMNNKEFNEIATRIHKEIDFNPLINDKKSNYNNKLFMTECQICQKKPKKNEVPLETHHIIFQKDTDKNGFLNDKPHKHKNHKSNLVVLCQKCHDKIDNGSIIIEGYDETSKGNELKYKKIRKKKV